VLALLPSLVALTVTGPGTEFGNEAKSCGKAIFAAEDGGKSVFPENEKSLGTLEMDEKEWRDLIATVAVLRTLLLPPGNDKEPPFV
jgi:hypothetical protein